MFGISSDYLAEASTPAGISFHQEVLGAGGHVRVFVAYDARGYFNGTECASSPAYLDGAVAWNQLLSALGAAQAEGLAAEVVFDTGTGIGSPPADPDPASPAQAADYSCGIRLALSALAAAAAPPVTPVSFDPASVATTPVTPPAGSAAAVAMPAEFEAWNEPDNDGYAENWNEPCATPDVAPSCSGPWQAAMLWYLAQTQANSLHNADPVSFPTVTVAALTMSRPEKLYFFDANRTTLSDSSGQLYGGYYQELWGIVHCAAGFGGCEDTADSPTTMPSAWAVHDYADVTAGGTRDLAAFETALAQLNDRYASGAGAAVWITEAGVQLNSSFRTDDNDPDGVRCAAPGVAADTFGCMVDGNPAAQARGGTAWLALAGVAHPTDAGTISVTQLYWYQFALGELQCTATAPCHLGAGVTETAGETLPGLFAWDSALVDSSGGLRASFCAITRQPSADCTGRADDYANAHWEDWFQDAEMPAACPAHYGAWVADNADSGVSGGEECFYSPNSPPTAVTGTRGTLRGGSDN
jgi:hypothetical protein